MFLQRAVESYRLWSKIPIAKWNSVKIVRDFCYHYNVSKNGVIIDVGCASEPQVGNYFASRGWKVYLVDPTNKHRQSLEKICALNDCLTFLPVAVGANSRTMSFFEPFLQTSGSLISEHRNTNADGTSYEVDIWSIAELKKKTGSRKISFLKLDLEGAEYELIDSSNAETWRDIDQVFIEFHHHCTPYTYDETIKCVMKLSNFGYKVFKLHNDVFLFYRSQNV
jgi:FkbM family methyltransferase